jgi:hypothetical protein
LLAINDRIVDLLPVARRHYYHPSQEGSWSLKAVLPAVAPDLDNQALEGVQDGGTAMDAFLRAIHTDTSTAGKREIEKQLREYYRLLIGRSIGIRLVARYGRYVRLNDPPPVPELQPKPFRSSAFRSGGKSAFIPASPPATRRTSLTCSWSNRASSASAGFGWEIVPPARATALEPGRPA